MATQEQIDKVRAYCFNPTEAELPDAIISAQIDKWLAVYPKPEQEGIVLYNATIDCLRYLIYNDPNGGGGSEGYRRREKVGQVEVETEYSGAYVSKWANILSGYLNGDLTIPGYKRPLGKHVIVGGVERDEIERVARNCNNQNGLGCFSIDRKGNNRLYSPYDPIQPWTGRRR